MWVIMQVDIINQDKGYLQTGGKYNLPKNLAEDLLKNNQACLPEENQATGPSEIK